jgi:hypothetical protein
MMGVSYLLASHERMVFADFNSFSDKVTGDKFFKGRLGNVVNHLEYSAQVLESRGFSSPLEYLQELQHPSSHMGGPQHESPSNSSQS